MDEGHLLQRWSSWGPKAEIHPSQNHCHSGSRGGSGPVTHAHQKTQVSAAQTIYSWLLLKVTLKVTSASCCEFIKTLCVYCVYVCTCVCVCACLCVCSHWPACLWWWGWTRKGRACRPPQCRHRSKPARSSHPGTAGRRILYKHSIVIYAALCKWGGVTLEFNATNT